MKSVYLAGSLRNPIIPHIGNKLRAAGLEVFDEWFGGGKIADDEWQNYEKVRGRPYKDALKGYGAVHIFNFDKHHLDRTDCTVLVMPAGRSSHLELGYVIGKGKPGYVLFDKEPKRFDVMYQFADGVFFSVKELIGELNAVSKKKEIRAVAA